MDILKQLASGDPETWKTAFDCLYPVAFEAARTRLGNNCCGECEDVAMETLSDILENGAQVKEDYELKPYTAAIARNKATDRLRRQLAEKRGGNKVQSLDELMEANASELENVPHDEFTDRLTVRELQELLTELSVEIKKEYRVVLRDYFFDQLSYKEISTKRNISVGSVGIYLRRGLAKLRNVIARRPTLQSEFLAMISDGNVVRVLLPLISVVKMGGWFYMTLYAGGFETVTHVVMKLRAVDEDLPADRSITDSQRGRLIDKLGSRLCKQTQLRPDD